MARSVVVTGANSGIGLVTAVELARHGYDVIGTVRSDEKGAQLVDAARGAGAVVRWVLCEVTDADSTEQAFREVAAMTDGGPWAVVNNAGSAQPGAIEDVTDEAARWQFELHAIAPARIARLVLPAMRERGDGRIVMMSSIAGRMALPLLGWYSASKHALEAMTDALRIEVAPFGVKVVLVEPGSFGTNIWDESVVRLPDHAGSAYKDVYERALQHTDKARMLPDPVWVARTVRLALASPVPLARYVIGVDAMLGAALESVAPTFVSDFVKGVGSGVRRLPFGLRVP